MRYTHVTANRMKRFIAIVTAVLAFCGVSQGATVLSYAPRLGAVTTTTMRIQIRADAAASADIEYVPHGNSFSGAPTVGAYSLVSGEDFTHTFQISVLTANTQYDFRVTLDGVEQTSSPGGTFPFTTAPSSTTGSFSFIVHADYLNCTRKRTSVWDGIVTDMISKAPNFTLMVGDQFYSDLDMCVDITSAGTGYTAGSSATLSGGSCGTGGSQSTVTIDAVDGGGGVTELHGTSGGGVSTHCHAGDLATLSGGGGNATVTVRTQIYPNTESLWWDFYKQTYRTLWGNLQSLYSTVPTLATWDDHDYGSNDSDSTYAYKTFSRAAFGKYWANPDYVETNAAIYYKWSYGAADFFVLDDRWYRVEGTSIIGATEMSWLKSSLFSSTAAVKFIVSGVAFGDWAKGNDSWNASAATKTERTSLFDYICNNSIKNVVLLTGDQHWSAIALNTGFSASVPSCSTYGGGVVGFYESENTPANQGIVFGTAVGGNVLYTSGASPGNPPFGDEEFYSQVTVHTDTTPATVTFSVREYRTNAGTPSNPYNKTFNLADTIPPVPGNSGTLTPSGITSSTVTLSWTKATDDISAQNTLQYEVRRSASNNISSVTTAESNGSIVAAYATDIATSNLTGLSAGTNYFNVIVKDEAGNKAVYTTVSVLLGSTTRYATDCTVAAINTQMSASIDGDVVEVPRGACTWSTQLSITKGISVVGAGCTLDMNNRPTGCQTVITDNIADGTPLVYMAPVTGYTTRIGFMQFNPAGFSNSTGLIKGEGCNDSRRIRIDHIFYNDIRREAMLLDTAFGVVDHVNQSVTPSRASVINRIYGNFYGACSPMVSDYGDASMAAADNYGTSAFTFFEDSAVTPTTGRVAATDSQYGGRYVWRHNVNNGNSTVEAHGREAQRYRSFRATEIYSNTFSGSDQISTPTFFRGGTGLIHDNTISGFGGAGTNFSLEYNQLLQYSNYPLGGSPGNNNWDVNNPSNPFATGTVQSASSLTLVMAGQPWSAQLYNGYSIRKTSGLAVSSQILSGSTVTTTTTTSHGLAAAHYTSLSGGTGYSAANGVSTTGGTGSGLKVNIYSVSGGVITSLIISDRGNSGYLANDVVTISGGGGNATITITDMYADVVSCWGASEYYWNASPYVLTVTSSTVFTYSNSGFWTSGTSSSPTGTMKCTKGNNFAAINDVTLTGGGTTTTITWADGPNGGAQGYTLFFDSVGGDTFEINKVTQGFDQPGRSGGTNLNGATLPTQPMSNNQSNDPWYQWANTREGGVAVNFGIGRTGSCHGTCTFYNIVNGTHYNDSTFSYTPYTYPNPLTNVADVIVPVRGNSGTIDLTSTTSSGTTLTWTAGTDDVTAQAALQYEVCQSTINNLATIADCESQTIAMSFTANTITFNATGLTPSTPYYFNVVVRDAAGNKTIYTAALTTTSVLSPPSAGTGALKIRR